MKFDISFLKGLGAATIAYGLIFFIALRLFKNSNNMKKCIFSLIIGGVLVTANVIALLCDYLLYGFSEEYMNFFYPYFAFPIMAVLFTIIIPLIFFILGKRRYQSFKNDFKYYSKKRQEEEKAYDKQARQTIYDENNKYLYLALKFEDKFLLKEVTNSNDEKEYSGLVVKFTRGENFNDEFLNKVIQSLELDVKESSLSGKVVQKKNNGKNAIYYVYTLDLNSITNKIMDMVQVSPVVLYGYNLNDFNKQILFRLVLREYFELEI